MSENKTSCYFKYAIGEIILVVIGILIALQINNWNEGTKEQNKETIYLKNLERDLTNQLDFIDDQISYETDFTNAASYLLSSFNGKNFIKIDTSFFRNLTLLQSRKTFLINDPTYTDMLSSGNIDIIKNKNIKDKLIHVINLRHMLSLGSLSLMETSKKNTQLLLEELKNLNKKN
jgi:hypothetical protein